MSDLKLLNGTTHRLSAFDDVLIRVVTDPGALGHADCSWNWLVDECSDNPLLLSSYVVDRMETYSKKGWSPLLLIISKGHEILGSVPIRVKRQFGVRYAKLLLEPQFSPEFVFREEYREVCTEELLEFLFNKLKLNYLDFTLQGESPNLPILKKICESENIHIHESYGNAHRVLPVTCSWDVYVDRMGKKFKKFKEIKNRLDRAGSWRIVSFENGEISRDVFKRVLDIEKMSWKEKWRRERWLGRDEHYAMVWNASSLTEDTSVDYDWSIYFLELDGRTISFVIVLRYKGCSVILKTSFDDRYGRFSPGKFVMNAAIRDQFKDYGIKTIEMLTDLEFLGSWGPSRLPRVRIIMSNSRLLPKFIYRYSESSFLGGFTISEFMSSLFDGQALRRLAMDWHEG